ncbi:hypothetical protein BC831DRAFT_452669 [Entophlyctis helioformis]|nr:hypothetical protein BC831DRAFT_452669 [Entophlyctis helioformis]
MSTRSKPRKSPPLRSIQRPSMQPGRQVPAPAAHACDSASGDASGDACVTPGIIKLDVFSAFLGNPASLLYARSRHASSRGPAAGAASSPADSGRQQPHQHQQQHKRIRHVNHVKATEGAEMAAAATSTSSDRATGSVHGREQHQPHGMLRRKRNRAAAGTTSTSEGASDDDAAAAAAGMRDADTPSKRLRAHGGDIDGHLQARTSGVNGRSASTLDHAPHSAATGRVDAIHHRGLDTMAKDAFDAPATPHASHPSVASPPHAPPSRLNAQLSISTLMLSTNPSLSMLNSPMSSTPTSPLPPATPLSAHYSESERTFSHHDNTTTRPEPNRSSASTSYKKKRTGPSAGGRRFVIHEDPIQWSKSAPLDISPTAKDYDKLTPAEVQTCSILRLMPEVYLRIKTIMLTARAEKGMFKKRDAQRWCRIDVNKTARLYDWFVQLGWLISPI